MRQILAALVLCLAGPVLTQAVLTRPAVAQIIESSPRPRPPLRVTADPLPVAEGGAEEVVVVTEAGLTRSPRPLPRPANLVAKISALAADKAAPGLDLGTDLAKADVDLAAVTPPSAKEKRRKKREAASMEGAVCGAPSIKGIEIAAITSNIDGCGVADAVQVTSVAGVQLSQAVTVECSVVQALDTWVKDVAQPAFDGKLSELRVAAHYICRSRNNKKGTKISEHGKGRAIDISAFVLTDGKMLSVSDDFTKTLRRIYKAACGTFRTTLGPGSDGYHEDHFHFDTAVRDGGAYCR